MPAGGEPGSVDPHWVGTWALDINSENGGRWVWQISSSGTYELHSEAFDGTPTNVGTLSAQGGHYTLHATNITWAKDSLPQIALVELHAVFLQQREELILERNPLVMSRLIADITDDRLAAGFADAERSIPTLPREGAPLRPLLLDPTRGVRLHDPLAI